MEEEEFSLAAEALTPAMKKAAVKRALVKRAILKRALRKGTL